MSATAIPCFAYLRVSSVGQAAEDKDGYVRQLAAVEEYARLHDYEIQETFRDSITGKTELEGRAGLAACMEQIEISAVKIVLVESADRIARDALIGGIIIREFKKVGVTVIAANGGVNLTEPDDSHPTEQLIQRIMFALAEWERCMIVEKLRAARQRCKAKNGQCEGVKPYGHDPNRPEEAAILAAILLCHKSDWTAEMIAKDLNYKTDPDNLTPARNGGDWSPSTIRKIIRREAQHGEA